MDHAMHRVSQNLDNCRNKSYNKSTIELEGYSRPTCSKQPWVVNCRIGVINNLDQWRRRQRDRLAVAKFSRVWNKFPEGSTLIFVYTQISFNTLWDKWKEASRPK